MTNEITKPLGLNAYDGQVNIVLFNDIINFILSVTAEPKDELLEKLLASHMWFSRTKGEEFQERYGFRYLGELLERYEEKFGSDIADTRAIALAMGFAKDIITDDMFVGRQKANFMRKITKLADADLYLKGALFKLVDKKDSLELRSELENIASTCTKTEELLFIVSLYGDFARCFEVYKPHLNRMLGTERSIDIAGNEKIFCWIINHLWLNLEIKTMRGKDMSVFRALIELPVAFVKENNKHHAHLLGNGYTTKDIVFLNSVVVRNQTSRDSLSIYSITAEKLAVEACVTLLNSENDHIPEVYEHLEWLFTKYSSFAIKIGGHDGILCAIHSGIKLVNPQTFIWLYKQTNSLNRYNKPKYDLSSGIFTFDILDEKWNVLVGGLGIEHYDELFNYEFMKDARELPREQIEEKIRKYEMLTGLSYLEGFHKKYCWSSDARFAVLVKKGIINIADTIEACDWQGFSTARGSDEKLPAILEYIRDFVKSVSSREAFEFIRHFLSIRNFDDMCTLFSDKPSYNNEAFSFSKSLYKNRHWNTHDEVERLIGIERDFLTDEEHKELFGWLDDYMFHYEADQYVKFIVSLLCENFAEKLFSKDELRQMYDMVKTSKWATDYPSYGHHLKDKYWTEEEFQAEKDENEARKAENDRIAEEKRLERLNETIESIYDGTLKSIKNFTETSDFYKDDLAKMAANLFKDALLEKDYFLSSSEVKVFIKIITKFYTRGIFTFEDYKNNISKVEQKEDNEHVENN